ncbi:arginase family protein [Paracoccus aminophilus]|uniref:Arginase/agmatinase/formiminoglutamase n=1 Tax=Paracoccus aminophilus JCM 7686 TaxID=1367847 RepID=S5YI18_PARAH|nr:arginase family protein [Paracoccus aminophilus]AGT11108.1 arginase/agmatinase/formiminoglutamase [Paracoccus aminophilus JCM 7686]
MSKVDLGALFGAGSDKNSFLGLEEVRDLNAVSAPMALLGVPCATPYASVGAYCRNAPDAIRAATASFIANIDRHDFDIGGKVFPEPRLRAVDCGDLDYDETDSAANRDRIRTAVSTLISRGAVPLLVGGDDSIPVPMLEALNAKAEAEGRELTIIQIDAHIDWREIHMGERYGLSSTMRRASELSQVKRIIQIGARGIGSGATEDYEAALAWGVHFVTAAQLHKIGAEAALASIPEGSDIVICIDADAFNSSDLPGVIARGPGGLEYYQVVDLIQTAAAKGRIKAMDFVEFMPERDIDGMGALTFARTIITAMGVIARQAG